MGTKLRKFETDSDLVHALSMRECDGVLTAKFQFYQLKHHPQLVNRCKLHIVGDTVVGRESGWLMRGHVSNTCITVLQEALSYHFHAMMDDGTITRLLTDALNRRSPPCQEPQTDSNSGNSRLDVDDMSGILIIHAAGCALSVLVFLCSRCWPFQKVSEERPTSELHLSTLQIQS